MKSLVKALRILECFSIKQPVLGVTELAELMGISKSNVSIIVNTFTQMGYLKKLENGKYTPGLKLLEYAYIINKHLGYPDAVYDIMYDVATKTNQIVYFGIPYGCDVLYLYVVHPRDLFQARPYREMLGAHVPMCATGIGKAILANFPEDEWEERIPDHIEKFTERTIVDRNQLFDELRLTKKRGYSIDNEERDRNIRCIGVPIFNNHGQLVAGMSVSGPTSVMQDNKITEYAEILYNASQHIASRIYK